MGKSTIFCAILLSALVSGCRSQGNFVLGVVKIEAHLPNNGSESHTSDGTNETDIASGTIRVLSNDQRANGADTGNSPSLELPILKP